MAILYASSGAAGDFVSVNSDTILLSKATAQSNGTLHTLLFRGIQLAYGEEARPVIYDSDKNLIASGAEYDAGGIGEIWHTIPFGDEYEPEIIQGSTYYIGIHGDDSYYYREHGDDATDKSGGVYEKKNQMYPFTPATISSFDSTDTSNSVQMIGLYTETSSGPVHKIHILGNGPLRFSGDGKIYIK